MFRLARLFSLFLALVAGPLMAAPLTLASIQSYYLDFQAEVDLGSCQDRLVEALSDEMVHTTLDRGFADAVYVIRIKILDDSGMRKTLQWQSAVHTPDERVLFQDGDEESGWSLGAACEDAADDIAENLADEIRQARVNRAELPLPRPQHRPGQLTMPTTTPDAAIIPPAPAPETDSGEGLRVREIDTSAGQAEPAPAPLDIEYSNEPSKWRKAARLFSMKHGCMDKFITIQSLPSGAEVYTTHCENGARIMFVCTSLTSCEMDR